MIHYTLTFLYGALFILYLDFKGIQALRDVKLLVPSAVKVGDTVALGCKYTLDQGESLYSVKWYRGRQEFFRFIPKEMPDTRVFPQKGINVDVSKSGAEQVVIRDATRSLAGRFRCEVSADAPSFHTEVKSAYIHVVELPGAAPTIRAEKGWYSAGDALRAHCTSPPSDPPANLTWLLNGNKIQGKPILHQIMYPSQSTSNEQTTKSTIQDDTNNIIYRPWKTIDTYIDNVKSKPEKSHEVTTDLEVIPTTEVSNKLPSTSQLSFLVRSDSFQSGRMTLTCISSVHTVYMEKVELVIEEEKPQIASVLGTRDASSGALQSSTVMLFLVLLSILQQKNWLYLR